MRRGRVFPCEAVGLRRLRGGLEMREVEHWNVYRRARMNHLRELAVEEVEGGAQHFVTSYAAVESAVEGSDVKRAGELPHQRHVKRGLPGLS